MKKTFRIITLITALALLCTMMGCNKSDKDTTVSDQTTDPSSNKSPEIETFVSASYTIYTFEEICDFATDVVIATFEGHRPYSKEDYNITEYTFKVKDRILGDADDVINVYENSTSDDHGGMLVPLSIYPEYEYILILEDRTSVYDNTVKYQFILNTLINLTDPEDSKTYGQRIGKYSDFDFINATREGTIDYISELVKDNKPSVKLEESPALDTVIKNSENIISVKVGECYLTRTDVFQDVGYYYCTVTETFKGNLKVGSEISICLNNKDIKDTDELIVAINYSGTNQLPYKLSTKNSVFSITDKSVIVDAIAQE